MPKNQENKNVNNINCNNKRKRGKIVTKICPSCGKSFESLESQNKKYCSQKCNQERNEKYIIYNCDGCGKPMRIKKELYQDLLDGKRKTITCSYECMGKTKRTGHEIKCDNCGAIFYRRQYHIDRQADRGQHNFCSLKCQKEYMHKETYEIRKCEICGKEFECSKKSKQRFCSNKCNAEWQKTLIGINNKSFTSELIECNYCHKNFYQKQHKIRNNQHNFCLFECWQHWYAEIGSQQDNVKERSRKTMLRELSNGEISKTNSLPQQIIDNLLNDLNINFEREKNVKYYSVDNYLNDYNLMIEIQGDYWHCNPIKFNKKINKTQYDRISKDKAKHTYIKNHYGIELLYLWEDDIINNIDLCKKLILEYIKNNGKLENYHSFNYILNDDKIKLSDNIIVPYQDMNTCKYKHLYQES